MAGQCGGQVRIGARLIASACVVLLAAAIVASPAAANHGGPDHWHDQGLARAQIYFVDHTGPFWPVASSVYKWNEASGVDSYYETSCPSSSLHCVDVGNYSMWPGAVPPACVGAYACTSTTANANHHFTSVNVYLNAATVNTDFQARKTTCHELGHALGLHHRYTNDSCMTQGEAPPISRYPDDHDFSALTSLYNHTD